MIQNCTHVDSAILIWFWYIVQPNLRHVHTKLQLNLTLGTCEALNVVYNAPFWRAVWKLWWGLGWVSGIRKGIWRTEAIRTKLSQCQQWVTGAKPQRRCHVKANRFWGKKEVWIFPEYKWGMFIYSWMGIKSRHCGWKQGLSGTTETCFLYLHIDYRVLLKLHNDVLRVIKAHDVKFKI